MLIYLLSDKWPGIVEPLLERLEFVRAHESSLDLVNSDS